MAGGPLAHRVDLDPGGVVYLKRLLEPLLRYTSSVTIIDRNIGLYYNSGKTS